ncbi:MAG: DNA glycosylase AlkZ-like family protein [Bryobacteraceae bacterium]
MLAVASRLCGLHAQLMSSAELTVWARVEDLDRRAVQRALGGPHARQNLGHAGHPAPASRERVTLVARGSRRQPRYLRPAVWQRDLGIAIEKLDRLTEAVAAALDGRVMTREELAQEVSRGGVPSGSDGRSAGCFDRRHAPLPGRVPRLYVAPRLEELNLKIAPGRLYVPVGSNPWATPRSSA